MLTKPGRCEEKVAPHFSFIQIHRARGASISFELFRVRLADENGWSSLGELAAAGGCRSIIIPEMMHQASLHCPKRKQWIAFCVGL